MEPHPYNVLFLCTANSARSLMAEAILNHLGHGRFVGYSAGSRPAGQANPAALALIEQAGLPTDALHSKSWDEFSRPDAPRMDFIFTVCDQVAGEQCPVWPGHPVSAHWGIPDPAAVTGDAEERERAMHDAFRQLSHRIALFISLPVDKLDRTSLLAELYAIGQPQTADA